MRSTVSKILQVEADRLYEISIREGLTSDNLIFLNKLIDTYEKFVGTAEEETPPEEQDTAALLASIIPKPEPRDTGAEVRAQLADVQQRTFEVTPPFSDAARPPKQQEGE